MKNNKSNKVTVLDRERDIFYASIATAVAILAAVLANLAG